MYNIFVDIDRVSYNLENIGRGRRPRPNIFQIVTDEINIYKYIMQRTTFSIYHILYMRFFEVIPLDFSIYLMNNGYKLGDHKILGDEKEIFFSQNLGISVYFKLQIF